jgi:sugar phosphate isomerase/epimerase
MFEKLGIVTNIWSEEIENGARFDDLMVEFGANGFEDMEVREGDYLRNSEFGALIQQLESAMLEYTDSEFRTICDAAWRGQAHETKHPSLFEAIASFAEKASGLILSYAMSHPWLSAPNDKETDTQQIVSAKKLAYLLCPARPRLRLVDLDSEGDIDEAAAIANLKHYSALLPDYPMIFAVENARQTATLTLKLAVAGGAKLTYDETNTYRADGTTVNPPDEFWGAVKMTDLTSVHFKQKTEAGVLSEVDDGFVDFRAIAEHLKTRHYTGDLLLENTPTAHSLQDALRSREYLFSC